MYPSDLFREEAVKNINAWLRVHEDACRTGDVVLRKRATERIAYWCDEVLQHD